MRPQGRASGLNDPLPEVPLEWYAQEAETLECVKAPPSGDPRHWPSHSSHARLHERPRLEKALAVLVVIAVLLGVLAGGVAAGYVIGQAIAVGAGL